MFISPLALFMCIGFHVVDCNWTISNLPLPSALRSSHNLLNLMENRIEFDGLIVSYQISGMWQNIKILLNASKRKFYVNDDGACNGLDKCRASSFYLSGGRAICDFYRSTFLWNARNNCMHKKLSINLCDRKRNAYEFHAPRTASAHFWSSLLLLTIMRI